MIVHLVDGTYELFRQFYGRQRSGRPDVPFGATIGVLHSVLAMLVFPTASLGTYPRVQTTRTGQPTKGD